MKSIILLAGLMLCHDSFCMKTIDEGVENELPAQVAGQVAVPRQMQPDLCSILRRRFDNIVRPVQNFYKDEAIDEMIELLMPTVREKFGSPELIEILIHRYIGGDMCAPSNALFRCYQKVAIERGIHLEDLFTYAETAKMSCRLFEFECPDDAMNLINSKICATNAGDFSELLRCFCGDKTTLFHYSNNAALAAIMSNIISRGEHLFGGLKGLGDFFLTQDFNNLRCILRFYCNMTDYDQFAQKWHGLFSNNSTRQLQLLWNIDEDLLVCGNFYKYIANNKEIVAQIIVNTFLKKKYNDQIKLKILKLAVCNGQLLLEVCNVVYAHAASRILRKKYGNNNMLLYFLVLVPASKEIIESNPCFYMSLLERSPVKNSLIDVIKDRLYVNNPIFHNALDVCDYIFHHIPITKKNILQRRELWQFYEDKFDILQSQIAASNINGGEQDSDV